MSDRTRSAHQQQADARDRTAVAVAVERLPYHPSIQERFGVDRSTWRALVEAVFPAAKTVEGVILALSYCRARGLDPMKRPVHVVPIWNKDKRAYDESVWPGIGEQRTTAFRTAQYAGCDETKFGPTVTEQFTGMTGRDGQQRQQTIKVAYPEWAQLTVYRMLAGNRISIPGPRVYWLETYARLGRSDLPNEMWQKRPFGQIEKCAEAAALRRAFPEEVGNEPTAEEMGADDGPTLDMTADGDFRTADTLASAPATVTPAAQPEHVDPPAAKPRQEPRQPAQRAPAAKAAPKPEAKPEPVQEPPSGQFDDAPPAATTAAATEGFQAFLAAPDGTDIRAEPYTDPVTFATALAAAVVEGFTTREIWDCNLAAVEDAADASPEARAILNAHHKALVDAEVAEERQADAAPEVTQEPATPDDPDRRKLMDRIADLNACRNINDLNAWNDSMVVKTFAQRMKVNERDDIMNDLRAAYTRKKEELTAKG